MALIGFMGSGKSTVGAEVARISGAPFVDLDTLIEDAFGRSIASVFVEDGEEVFRRKESELLKEALKPGVVVALGGGAPVDDANWAEIKRRALSVWLEVPFELLWPRLEAEAGRPLLAGRSPAKVRELYQSRVRRYAEADHRVDGARELSRIAHEVVTLWSA